MHNASIIRADFAKDFAEAAVSEEEIPDGNTPIEILFENNGKNLNFNEKVNLIATYGVRGSPHIYSTNQLKGS